MTFISIGDVYTKQLYEEWYTIDSEKNFSKVGVFII